MPSKNEKRVKVYLTPKGFLYHKVSDPWIDESPINYEDIEIYDSYVIEEEIPAMIDRHRTNMASFHEHPFYTHKKNELRIAALEEKLSEIARIFSK